MKVVLREFSPIVAFVILFFGLNVSAAYAAGQTINCFDFINILADSLPEDYPGPFDVQVKAPKGFEDALRGRNGGFRIGGDGKGAIAIGGNGELIISFSDDIDNDPQARGPTMKILCKVASF